MKFTGKIMGLIFLLLSTGFSFSLHAATNLAEYQSAMTQLEADLDRRSAERFRSITDFDNILQRTFAEIENDIDPGFKKGFIKGFKNKGINNLVQKMLGMMPDQNGAQLIRVVEENGKVHAAMRLDYQDMGYGYLDFELEKDKRSGEVRIVDWYDYQAGQNYSRSLMQIVATLSPNSNLIRKIFDIASGKTASAKQILEMISASNRNEMDRAKSLYTGMDESIKKNWVFMIISVNMANMSGDMEFYKQVLVDAEKYFSDDPRASFVLIDYYILQEQYDEAIQRINQLSNIFKHRDAGLWHMNANTHLMKGSYSHAIKSARKGIQLEPDFELVYWSLLNAQVLAGDNSSATETIRELEQRFGYLLTRDILAQDEVYKDYVNSPEYLQLERSR